MPNLVKHGIDHADMAWIRAPRPTLILAAEKDYVDFKSTTEVAGELQQLYTAIDAPDNTGLFSFNDKHGFSKPRREAAVRWMSRWLKDDDSPVVEGEIRPPSAQALLVTKSGQVLKEYEGEKPTIQLALDRAQELADQRARFWAKDKEDALSAVKEFVGSTKTSATQASVEHQGAVVRDGYQIEKLIIRGTDQLPIPALLFNPDARKEQRHAHLYVNDRGKSDDHALETIEPLVRAGALVLSVDVRGYGETTDPMCRRKRLGREYGIAALSLQLGTPLLGQRVDDLMAAADVLLKRPGVKSLSLIGVGNAGPIALHAAALDPRFASVTLEGSIQSWTEIIRGKPDYGSMIFGALKTYDLPDLVKAIEPRTVKWTPRASTRKKK